jgi:hypothetical protein
MCAHRCGSKTRLASQRFVRSWEGRCNGTWCMLTRAGARVGIAYCYYNCHSHCLTCIGRGSADCGDSDEPRPTALEEYIRRRDHDGGGSWLQAAERDDHHGPRPESSQHATAVGGDGASAATAAAVLDQLRRMGSGDVAFTYAVARTELDGETVRTVTELQRSLKCRYEGVEWLNDSLVEFHMRFDVCSPVMYFCWMPCVHGMRSARCA